MRDTTQLLDDGGNSNRMKLKNKMSELPEDEVDEAEEEADYGDQGENSADGDDIFKNNHDLIGVQGILRA